MRHWIATNDVFQRPIRRRQLFVYGPPSTQKILQISMLKRGGLRVGQRKNDYSGAHDYFDLWVIDEFMEDKPQSQFESEERGSYIHAVLTLLGRSAG